MFELPNSRGQAVVESRKSAVDFIDRDANRREVDADLAKLGKDWSWITVGHHVL